VRHLTGFGIDGEDEMRTLNFIAATILAAIGLLALLTTPRRH
jgi:hypothetical protein